MFRPASNSDSKPSGKQYMLMSMMLKATGKISVLSETSAILGNRHIPKPPACFDRKNSVGQNALN